MITEDDFYYYFIISYYNNIYKIDNTLTFKSDSPYLKSKE
jgi:hypothetical protein